MVGCLLERLEHTSDCWWVGPVFDHTQGCDGVDHPVIALTGIEADMGSCDSLLSQDVKVEDLAGNHING